MGNGVTQGWLTGHFKFAVSMSCPGFDMDEDDWRITVINRDKTVIFTKDNSVRDDGQWFICLDSAEIGPGTAYIVFEAFVPDDDFPGGIRQETEMFELIKIKKIHHVMP